MALANPLAIAEKNPIVRESLENMAQNAWSHVVAGATFAECLEKCGNAEPEGWIMGLDLLTEFTGNKKELGRTNSRFFPVVCIVPGGDDECVKSVLKTSCMDYFLLPLDSVQFSAYLKSLAEIQNCVNNIGRDDDSALSLCSAMRAKDGDLFHHAGRVSAYAVRFGRMLGLSEAEIGALQKGGLLHDVGKLGIPSQVFNKPGRLTPLEYEVIKRHPGIGIEICKNIVGFSSTLLPLINYHHERLDGTGYPSGLNNGDIPVLARIINIVDIYEALTNRHTYREAYSTEAAFGIMYDEASKGWWDQELIKSWEKLIR